MRIIFAGTPEFAVPSLRRLAEANHDIAGVITREDAPIGRKRVLTPSPIAAEAERLGFEVFKANRLSEEANEWAAGLGAELGVIVAYGGLLREPLLSLPRLGWINLHFSTLPRWRGAAPVQRALMAGEQDLGVTVFRLVEALDAGDVLTSDSREFPPGTSAGSALTELADFGTDALLHAIDMLANDSDAGEPQAGEANYAHKLSREDGLISFGSETREAGSVPAPTTARVLAHWAGVTPAPGAYAELDDQAVKLTELKPYTSDGAELLAPGEVRLIGKRALVGCSDGVLEISRAQPTGKAAMDGAAWLRGRDGKADLA